MAFFRTKPKITIVCLIIATLGLGFGIYYIAVNDAWAYCGSQALSCPGCGEDSACCYGFGHGNCLDPAACQFQFDYNCMDCDNTAEASGNCCSPPGVGSPDLGTCASGYSQQLPWLVLSHCEHFGKCDTCTAGAECEDGWACGDDEIGISRDRDGGWIRGKEVYISNSSPGAICDGCQFGVLEDACCDGLSYYKYGWAQEDYENKILEFEGSRDEESTITVFPSAIHCAEQPQQCLVPGWPDSPNLDDHEECCVFNLGYQEMGPATACLWDGSTPELYTIDNLNACYDGTGSTHPDSPIVEQEYNPGCCNDDTHEFMTRRWCDPWGELVDREGICNANLNDQACCRLPYERPDDAYESTPMWGHLADCVYNGQCYSHYNYYSGNINEVAVNLSDDQSTDREICGDFFVVFDDQSGGSWVDPDMNTQVISGGYGMPGDYCVMAGNEVGVDTTWVDSSTTTPCQTADRWSTNNQCWDHDTAIYGDPSSSGYCCGDDANEYYTDDVGNTACCATEGAEVNASGECTGGVSCEPAGQTNYYKITNSAGETVAQFGDLGYLEIAGSVADFDQGNLIDPGGNIFMVKDNLNDIVFYIDESGNLKAKSSLLDYRDVDNIADVVNFLDALAIQVEEGAVDNYYAAVTKEGQLFLNQCLKTGVTF